MSSNQKRVLCLESFPAEMEGRFVGATNTEPPSPPLDQPQPHLPAEQVVERTLQVSIYRCVLPTAAGAHGFCDYQHGRPFTMASGVRSTGGSSRARQLAPAEQVAHLFIGGLGEIAIPGAHRIERPRGYGTDDPIRLVLQLRACLRGRYPYRHLALTCAYPQKPPDQTGFSAGNQPEEQAPLDHRP
jgi:hypothetical protein